MGDEGGRGDAQGAKREEAAAAYDYDGDPRWAEYWSNVLIPPQMAFRSDVVGHYKRKFYQRFVVGPTTENGKSMTIFSEPVAFDLDPDFVIETMSSGSSSQSASVSARSSPIPRIENAGPQDSAPNSGASATSLRSSSSLQLDKRTIYFSVNAWVLIVALFGILPLVPRNLSTKAFRLSLLGTALCSCYSLYTLYGKPRAWNVPAVQTWFQSIISTKDFIHFIYCLMLVSSRIHFKFALIPVACWAVEHVAKFLRRNFSHSLFYRRYLQEACLWVEENPTTLSFLGSKAEIGLGFLLIMSLVSWHRNILQTFMYWQLLKFMYHAPVTAGYHRSVWAKICRTANPYIYRYVPFLNAPISAIQRWWFR